MCKQVTTFYLSFIVRYLELEVHNLSRFISTYLTKFHPLTWRTSHPYVLADRLEDVTPPEKVQMDKKCDRNITLYGYLRGCNLKRGMKVCHLIRCFSIFFSLKILTHLLALYIIYYDYYQVHIAGVGDYSLAGVTVLPDPCPLPSSAKKKGLRDREKLLHAPMSGIGDLLYDKDAVYININDHLVQYSKTDDGNGNGDPTNKGYLLVSQVLLPCVVIYVYEVVFK